MSVELFSFSFAGVSLSLSLSCNHSEEGRRGRTNERKESQTSSTNEKKSSCHELISFLRFFVFFPSYFRKTRQTTLSFEFLLISTSTPFVFFDPHASVFVEEKVSTDAVAQTLDASQECKSRLTHSQTRKTSSRKVMMLAFGTHQTRARERHWLRRGRERQRRKMGPDIRSQRETNSEKRE